MQGEFLRRTGSVGVGTAAFVLALGLAAGCKQQQPSAPTDQQIAQNVQAKIGSEGALAKQGIQASARDGVVTLSGSVTDDASRALAGNDAGTIAGVKTVVNNLTVQPAQQAAAPMAMPSEPPPPAPKKHAAEPKAHKQSSQPVEQASPVTPPQQEAQATPEPVAAAPQPPPPPPAPPQPTVKDVTIAEGTVVPIRITESLDSKTAQPNDAFHGSVAGDIAINGVVAVPRGSAVLGRVVDARDAAHFKGSSLLSIELTEVTVRGRRISLVTDAFNKEGAARGKNTAEKAGGGAALGAIIGAIAGGGKGAAIGGVAGAAAGTGVNAATRGQQVTIPTETVINFRLQAPITVRVTIFPQGSDAGEGSDPQLQPR